ncbi:TRAP transporter large permease [Halomonas salifodinae]|uniref:TRAP transporter large permease n=1 Tax=Halomonas salifodinae TaxID=438745 RepID=UPI00339EB48E
MNMVLFVLPVVFLALGFPVYLVILAAASLAVALFMNMPGVAIHQAMFGTLSAYSLLAVPFFLFAGELMARGSLSKRIIDWVMCLVGNMRGGLGMVTLGGSTFFGAISGSSVATVAGVGRLVDRPMAEQGYGPQFGSGLLASSAAIAQLIPPSIALILYGIAAEQSITKLFVAGILPGLVLAAVLGCYIYLAARRKGLQASGGMRVGDFWRNSRRAFLALMMPVFILGGIYGGVFSPTEAAGVACVYALVVSAVIYRDVDMAEIWRTAVNAMYLSAQIMIIVAAAGVFSWVLTINGVPRSLAGFVANLDLTVWQVILIINVLLLFVGCFMDTSSAILLFTPLLLPVALQVGIDPIHFGIIVTMNLSIGLFTPPFGLNLFMVHALNRTPMAEVYRGVLPFVLVSLIALLLVSYVPALSLLLVPYLG